ncbi:MAG TPA: prolyl oligopeptidase family serine peptidase [Pirellulaceae bacterium]|jgi:prolyl oligopeptidase|nr:prolyl oligopeptidase family serine peptidase [Pirellulaceae bacterium]
MKINSSLLFALAYVVCLTSHGSLFAQEGTSLTYPQTARADQVDDYHGTQVADPYRWLEDTDSPATRKWIEEQNKLTESFLSQVPQREKIKSRMTELWDYESFGLPRHRGGRYFFSRNTGLQNQSVLFVSKSLDSQPRELIDPNGWAEDGTVALADWNPSEDGKLLAYGLAAAGSDWREWKIKDVASGKDLEDHLQWVKFSDVSWSEDGSGLFYSRYDEPKEEDEFTGVNHFQKLYFHKIGDPQARDVLVYERPDEKEWGFGGYVTEDGKFLIINVWRGSESKNQLFYKDLARSESQVVELITGFDFEYEFVGNEGRTFWLNTDDGAPMRRVVAVDLDHPQKEHWQEVIGETDAVLRGVGLVGDRFLASYLRNAATQVKVFDLAGRFVREVPFSELGSAGGFGGRRADRETFYSFTNFATPATIYRYDVQTGESSVYRQPKVAFDPASYVTRQVFYRSKDGTRIPMFITHRRGLEPDGRNPTILYGYGGFDIPITPGFSVSNLVWLEMGGVYAVANLRGGGEFGRQWHEAGMRNRKQNVFDDFIAAGEWLIENKFTCTPKLAISGRSNGGLLVGACLTQRPDLYGAALPAVGVMDMLRYHKFTIGWAWVGEYGSSDDPDQFANLFKYSPLHRLQPGTKYPATMVTTADHDDRVVPGHSFKFAAALQGAQAGDKPTLIHIESRAGHGAGTPTSKRIESATDVLTFLVKSLDVAE